MESIGQSPAAKGSFDTLDTHTKGMPTDARKNASSLPSRLLNVCSDKAVNDNTIAGDTGSTWIEFATSPANRFSVAYPPRLLKVVEDTLNNPCKISVPVFA